MRQIRNHSLHCLRCSVNSACQPTIRSHSTLRSRFVPLSSPKLSYRAIQVYEKFRAGCNDSQLTVRVREGTGFLRTLGIQHSFSLGLHFTPLLPIDLHHRTSNPSSRLPSVTSPFYVTTVASPPPSRCFSVGHGSGEASNQQSSTISPALHVPS